VKNKDKVFVGFLLICMFVFVYAVDHGNQHLSWFALFALAYAVVMGNMKGDK
jgi:hypothetical protein